MLDLRTEKRVKVGTAAGVRLFLDLFNLTNNNAAETIVTSTGTRFRFPTNILGPRTARVGARVEW